MAYNILDEADTARFRELASAYLAAQERVPVAQSEAAKQSVMDVAKRMFAFVLEMLKKYPGVTGFMFRGHFITPVFDGQRIIGIQSSPLNSVLVMDELEEWEEGGDE